MKKIVLYIVSFFFVFFSINAKTTNDSIVSKIKSINFIENKGQWPNDVLYLTKLNNLNAWVIKNGVVYDYFKTEQGSIEEPDNSEKSNIHNHNSKTKINGHVLKMSFKNSQSYKKIDTNNLEDLNNHSVSKSEGQYKSETYFNYFLGNDSTKWANYVPLFKEVFIKDLYRGIDVRYYFDIDSSNSNGINRSNLSPFLRYDFVVHPGADLSQIKIEFEGQDNILVNDKGELILKTSIGDIYHGRLFTYQLSEKITHSKDELNISKKEQKIEEIKCSYFTNSDGTIGFKADNYDRTKVLIIDPLVFSTYIGGSGSDEAFSLNLDTAGYPVIVGETYSTNYPISSGAYQTSHTAGANYDLFVTKTNLTATAIVFSTYIGGTSDEESWNSYLDTNNCIYLSGYSYSSNYPITTGVVQTFRNGTRDCILTKLNYNGTSLTYSSYMGGSSEEWSHDMTINTAGNAFVSGHTTSSNYPTTVGAYQRTYAGSFDIILSKVNTTCTNYVYSTLIGSTSNDDAYAVAVDASDNAYVSGWVESSTYPITAGAFQSTYINNVNMTYLTKVNSSGSALIFSTYLGGGNERTYSLTIDNSNYPFIGGITNSTNFPTTIGAYQRTKSTSIDMFITKMNTTGTALSFSTFIGGNSDDDQQYNNLNFDENGNIIFAGDSYSSNFPVTADAHQSNRSGSPNAIITVLRNDGAALKYSTYLGGSSSDYGNGATYRSGFLYLAGGANSTNFPVTAGVLNTSNRGSMDAFITKICFSGCQFVYTGTVPASICPGTNINVPYTIAGTFNAGNIFTAQLSNATGSFAAATTIGTLTSTTAGTITCFIPKNTVAGNGYRIRVNASNPITIGTDNGVNLTINSLPTVNFTGNLIVCEKNIATYTSSTSTGRNYKWTATNGTIQGSGSNVSVNVLWGSISPGKIKLIEANMSTGCIDTLEKTVTINPLPKPNFTGDTVVCVKNFGNYTSNSTAGISNLWKVWGGNIVGVNNQNRLQVNWKDTVFAKITLIQTNDATLCVDSITKIIVLNPLPKPAINPGNENVCEKNDYNYSSNSTIPISDKWTVNGGTIIGADNLNSVKIRWDSIGTRVIKLYQTNSTTGCKDSITKNINVNALPKPQITGNNSVCMKTAIQYSVATNSDRSYLWSITNGTFVGLTTNSIVSVIWNKSGTGTIKCIETVLSTGCKDSTSLTVTILPSPNTPKITGDLEICARDTATYFTNPETGVTFTWQIVGGSIQRYPSPNSAFVIWSTPGTGTLKCIATNGNGCKDSTFETIKINPKPNILTDIEPVVMKGTQSIYNCLNNDLVSVLWRVKGGTISGPDNQKIVAINWNLPGNAKVTCIGTNSFGCIDSVVVDVIITNSNIMISGSVNVCEFNEYTYLTKESTDKSFQWFANNGIINGNSKDNSVKIKWSGTGRGYITLIQTNTTNKMEDTVTIEVVIFPLPKPVITGLNSVVKNTLLSYNASSLISGTNSWSAVGGTIQGNSTSSSINVLWGVPGVGQLKLVQSNQFGCKDSTIFDVTIEDATGPSITGKTAICEKTIESYVTTTPAGATSTWEIFGGILIGSNIGDKITVNWFNPGTGKLKVVQSDATKNWKDSSEKSIKINPLPKIILSKVADVCLEDSPFNLTFASPNGGTYSGVGVSAGIFNPLNAGVGTHTITYSITTAEGCKSKDSTKIIVNPMPAKPIITEVDSVLYSSVATGNQWFYEGAIIAGATNTSYRPNKEGFYSVEVVNEFGCKAVTDNPYYFSNGLEKPIISSNTSKIHLTDLICLNSSIDSVLIKNNGKKELIISKISITGANASDFTTKVNYDGTIIDTLSNKMLYIVFNPSSAGNKTATLTIESNAVNQAKLDISLNSQKDSIGFYISPISLNFADIIENNIDSKDINIYNTGNQSLTWTLPINISKNFQIIKIVPNPILPGASSVATIQFNGELADFSTQEFYDLTENICNFKSKLDLKANVLSGAKGEFTIRIGNAEANPGDSVSVPVYLENRANMTKSKIKSLNTNIEFNSTLLLPDEKISTLSDMNNKKIINVNIPITKDTSGIIYNLKYYVGLGNDIASILAIKKVEPIGDTNLVITKVDGYFKLTGLCYQGGARLLNPSGQINLSLIKPNPSNDEIEIEYETIENGITRITLINSKSDKIIVLSEKDETVGKHTLVYNLKDLVSGLYFINMETATSRSTLKFEVIK